MGWKHLLEEIPIQWRWIEEETVMPVGDLGIWPVTIETREDSREKNIGVRGKLQTFKQFKRGGESRVS